MSANLNHEDFANAVVALRVVDPAGAHKYISDHIDLAAELICSVPDLRQAIARVGAALAEMQETNRRDIAANRRDIDSLASRVLSLEERHKAEGKAIVQIIRVLSPSFSEDLREKLDVIVTEMEAPLHSGTS